MRSFRRAADREFLQQDCDERERNREADERRDAIEAAEGAEVVEERRRSKV